MWPKNFCTLTLCTVQIHCLGSNNSVEAKQVLGSVFFPAQHKPEDEIYIFFCPSVLATSHFLMLPTSQHQCMRTWGMRAHLTSLTLILVITASGQDGVSGVRRGAVFSVSLCLPACFRSLIILMSTAGPLLRKHPWSNIPFTCSFFGW